MTTKDNHLWIEIQVTRLYPSESGVGGRCSEITISPIKREPGEPNRYFGVTDDLGYLVAGTFVFDRHNLPVNGDVYYKSRPSVSLYTAKVITKVLSKIDLRMRRAVEKNGYPESFGQWVLQFCNALGAVGLVVYGQNTEYTGGDLVSKVNSIVAEERRWSQPE